MNLKTISSLLPYALIALAFYYMAGTLMYTREVASFYGYDWSFSEHGFVLNGKGMMGDMVSVASDLAAITPSTGGGAIEEWCPGVTSERGFVTMGFVGDTAVCCLAEENQWLVPFKDIDGQRHYLCGAWPNLDHVVRSLDDFVINVES
jgi:hypothetical protein